jgi:hypothetical protein
MMRFHLFTLGHGERFKVASRPRVIYRVVADMASDDNKLTFFDETGTQVTGWDLFQLNGDSYFVELVLPTKK